MVEGEDGITTEAAKAAVEDGHRRHDMDDCHEDAIGPTRCSRMGRVSVTSLFFMCRTSTMFKSRAWSGARADGRPYQAPL